VNRETTTKEQTMAFIQNAACEINNGDGTWEAGFVFDREFEGMGYVHAKGEACDVFGTIVLPLAHIRQVFHLDPCKTCKTGQVDLDWCGGCDSRLAFEEYEYLAATPIDKDS
jgi:hypothetical protein